MVAVAMQLVGSEMRLSEGYRPASGNRISPLSRYFGMKWGQVAIKLLPCLVLRRFRGDLKIVSKPMNGKKALKYKVFRPPSVRNEAIFF
jgi:hypothetical protein